MKGFYFVALFIFISSCSSHLPDFTSSMNQRNPTENKSEAIGEYSLGCLEGAKTFEGNEKGILISQVRRGRYWGHPELIRVLTEAGLHFDRIGKKIILGDLSLSRGGPTLTGHNSHQTGLDVDIWFEMPNKNEKRNFRTIETLDMAPIGELKKDQIDLIRYFTSRNEVERIFINPRMKKAICNHPQKHKLTTEELRKLRAWFGHDDHIHVRLFCPKDSPECISQKPVPEGDGCDQLDWWFSDEAQKDTPVYNSENQKTVYLDKIKNLPVRCEFYFKQD